MFNNGTATINELEISYTLLPFDPVGITLSNLNIAPFTSYEFEHPTNWLPAAPGTYSIDVRIDKVNGQSDENPDNNSMIFETEIYPHVVPPNRIDEMLATPPVFETIPTPANQLNLPTDLDFFPILGKNELWVINERNEDIGGSTLTIYDAGTPDQSFLHRVDGNAWHFMSLPTGIAFGDNFNWANSPGVKDANHNNGTFTGPTLWSSDPAIYAMPSGGNGSHIDMLHGSPYSMGIAHEVDNVYWVFDGWNETLVRYDFQEDHGPGNDDHSDAIVRRYTEIKVKADRPVPSHLVLDKASGWLYVVDNGNDRVLRLDINSGQVNNTLPLINEPLAEHSAVNTVTWEVIIDQGLSRPSGIEFIENRLLVSDYATGDIVVYDMDNNFAEIGRIATGQPGITGLKVGPDGAIWYTNRTQNSLRKISPGQASSTGAPELLAQVRVMPNPTTGLLRVQLPETGEATLLLSDFTGKQIQLVQHARDGQQLDLGALPTGVYLLSIAGEGYSTTRKVVLSR
ncbi:MAG: T9SS type A sorting domain-containing protein [Lewinellaceae bacterium]|nr:T9SS type A sorting domain-containing protein [Lewinellaceae bacterium]